MPKKRVVYGVANYAEQVQKNGYFVDKTEYIQKLELVENPVYLRPRRFGKSMFCSLLNYYYDLNEAEHFEHLFSHTWIGQHPTGNQNRYMILYLNFSSIEVGATLQQIESSFRSKCNTLLGYLMDRYAPRFEAMAALDVNAPVADNLNKLLYFIQSRGLPPLFVIIDEYDNFANHLIPTNRDPLYYALTADDSFFKTFFKALKEGREQHMHQFFEPSFFPISFFYLGMLTRLDDFTLTLPNLSVRKMFVEYFNELNQIDVSTRYSGMMQAFANRPNLEHLFAGYWQEYVSQLPEAIFQKVNENFYRTTFYELCSRYLSRWFSWHIERSYPQGKSDLEFVGKYNERYANLRWIIEFKYYSNSEFKTFDTTLETFALQPEDTEQIAGYAAGLRQEFPNAQIEQYVIYCIGNQGFRIFRVV